MGLADRYHESWVFRRRILALVDQRVAINPIKTIREPIEAMLVVVTLLIIRSQR